MTDLQRGVFCLVIYVGSALSLLAQPEIGQKATQPQAPPNAAGSGTAGFAVGKHLDTVLLADQFAGGDCGARIVEADRTLGRSTGEIWVSHNCGSTISTPVVIHQFHLLRFIDQPAGGYKVSAPIRIGSAGHYGAGMIATGGGRLSVAGPVSLIQADAANLPVMIQMAGPQSYIENLVIDGNKSHNPVAGTLLLVQSATADAHSAWMSTIRNVTLQNSSGFCLRAISDTNNEAAALKLSNDAFWGCELGGAYISKSTDVAVEHSEFENNGLGGGAFHQSNWPVVSTSGRVVTWVSGAHWTIDPSFIGRQVSINNTRYTVESVASPSSLTLTSSAGTQNHVPLRAGSGLEASDTRGPTIIFTDFGGNELNGIHVSGESNGVGGAYFRCLNCGFGNNIEEDVSIVGFDNLHNGFSSYGNQIIGSYFVGHRVVSGRWPAIYIQDSHSNLIANNTCYSPAGSYSHCVLIRETQPGREGARGKDLLVGNVVFGNFASGTLVSDQTRVQPVMMSNSDGLLVNAALPNGSPMNAINANGIREPVLGMDRADNVYLKGDPLRRTIVLQADGNAIAAVVRPAGIGQQNPNGNLGGECVLSGGKCVHRFAPVFQSAPACVVSGKSANNVLAVDATTSDMTVTSSSSSDNQTVSYVCVANPD